MPALAGSSHFYLLSFFLLFIVFGLCSPTVRSEDDSSVILLPTDASARSALTSCPVNCFRTDPVCGVDGVTYWCGCADAICSGTQVAKLGFCEIGNGGSGPVSGQALLLVHILWLIVLAFSVFFGLF